MSKRPRFRGMLCAWGTLAALLLGGCMLDATGTGLDEETIGTETDELATVDDEGLQSIERTRRGQDDDEKASSDEPDIFGAFLADPDDPLDPHPDPWRSFDTDVKGDTDR